VISYYDCYIRNPSTDVINAHSLDFKHKLQVFQSHLRPLPGRIDINVNRQNLFEDSFRVISRASATELKKRLHVAFNNEKGLDYGGLAREWFYFLSHEMFNPYYCLFEYSANNTYTLQISPHSDINPEHLQYFHFVGRITGMALYHGKMLDAYFVPMFYKQMLNKDISLSDIQSIDSSFYHSMTWLLENPVEELELTFSVTVNRFGLKYQHDLIPNGKHVAVTDYNKREYVRLYTKWRATLGTSEQMNAFMKGFRDLIQLESLQIFDEKELEFLTSGLNEIDIDDLHFHTVYKGYKENDPIICWFWTILSKFNNEQRARLLIFVTGTSRVPPTGFKDLQGSEGPRKFCIEKVSCDRTSLPRSHTW
jgi:E3 ubiquitin-protein ligase NEDD4